MAIYPIYATIKAAHKWSNVHFAALMEKYCPEVQLHIGPFGGRNWGDTYWSSFTDTGVIDLLTQRLVARIAELEKK